MDPNRLHLIRMLEKKWVNGTELKYYFFDRTTDGPNGAWVGSDQQRSVVRAAWFAKPFVPKRLELVSSSRK